MPFFISNSVAAPVYLRIADGPSDNEGRLEVYYHGEWGTVCSVGFDRVDADVACRQLGYNHSAAVYTHGGGSGRVWLDFVRCRGYESSLEQCDHGGWWSTCGHSIDVGIICAVTDLCEYLPFLKEDLSKHLKRLSTWKYK